MQPLPPSFYDRDALDVAYDLVGCEIAHAGVRVRIAEVEAYRFPGDTANHARAGRTARNSPMWGPPGRAYIYRCYGLHRRLNLVTGADGQPAAVLIRGAEPIDGWHTIRSRRGVDGPAAMNGPGKVGAALGIAVAQSGSALDAELAVFPRTCRPRMVAGARIGIDYATQEDRDAPWRVALAESAWVGHRRQLFPIAPR